MTDNPFEDKKITQMGLGVLGRGIQDACYLKSKGAKMLVTDLKDSGALEESVRKVTEAPGAHSPVFVLGEHRLQDFSEADYVLKGAGVPLDNAYIAEAEKAGIPIKMDASWFAELVPEGVTMVGITGTRGKSTTTMMIVEILLTAGKTVHAAGNLRGAATLPLLEIIQPGDYVVLELDSWQLQGFRGAGISPHVSVFTTFMDDHMNYYHDDRALYFKDKAAIYQNQTDQDTLVVGEVIPALAERYSCPLPKHVGIATEETLPADWVLNVPGKHNRQNAACALMAADALDIPRSVSWAALLAFKSPEGRLEKMNVPSADFPIYNDNNATTPLATEVALDALAKHELVLIMGGASKKLPLDSLLERLEGVHQIILLPGSGTDEIIPLLKARSINYTLTTSLQEAVEEGWKASQETEDAALLFSPAFASFGLFVNEYERNDQFINLIKKHA